MLFRQIFDPVLAQYAYLIGCQRTGEALLIDPERDVDRYVRIAEERGLTITAAAETHIHADFLSGARELALRHGVRVYLSDEGGEGWRYTWPDPALHEVVLLRDGDVFNVGNLRIQAIHTPGHTPEHLVFAVTDEGGGADAPLGLATGDFVFVGSLGRPDLLETAAGEVGAREPSARALYRSVLGFLELDDHLLLWPGHGAGSACGKALGSVPQSTVGYERRFNPALAEAREGEEAFVRGILEDQPEPPLYFARMKRLNRDGPPLLPGPPPDRLPRPARLDAAEALEQAADGAVLVDTRSDPAAFLSGHLPGSLHAPLGPDLATVAPSYVSAETPVVLVAEPGAVESAVRGLVRVGMDRIEGFVPTTALAGAELASIETTDVEGMRERARRADGVVVDVRGLEECRAGHFPGALLAPHVRLPEQAATLPDGPPLLLQCRTGSRATMAASYLAVQGRNVVAVLGDFEAWAAAHPEEVRRGVPASTPSDGAESEAMSARRSCSAPPAP